MAQGSLPVVQDAEHVVGLGQRPRVVGRFGQPERLVGVLHRRPRLVLEMGEKAQVGGEPGQLTGGRGVALLEGL